MCIENGDIAVINPRGGTGLLLIRFHITKTLHTLLLPFIAFFI